MEKKSRVLIAVFIVALFAALGYSYYRYVLVGDFLIDESQVEAEEVILDETTGELPVLEGDGAMEAGSEVEEGV